MRQNKYGYRISDPRSGDILSDSAVCAVSGQHVGRGDVSIYHKPGIMIRVHCSINERWGLDADLRESIATEAEAFAVKGWANVFGKRKPKRKTAVPQGVSEEK